MQSHFTVDAVPLHLRQWVCDGTPRGTLLIVHGLGEHIGRYEALARHLNRRGWAVVGYDQRGHGASGGARGAIAAPDSLLADLAGVIDAVRPALTGPLLLLGHSLGGLLAARFVAEGLVQDKALWWRPVDALVLSSPAMDPGMTVLQKVLLAVLGRLAPNLALGNGLNPAWVSRDPAIVEAYVADPLVHDRITPRLARFIVDAGRRVRESAPRWRVPTLLLYAGADRCVTPAGSAAFAAAAPPDVVTAQSFAPLFHEIFNEPERAAVLAALDAWLAHRDR